MTTTDIYPRLKSLRLEARVIYSVNKVREHAKKRIEALLCSKSFDLLLPRERVRLLDYIAGAEDVASVLHGWTEPDWEG